MKSLIERIWHHLAQDRNLSLQDRIYRLICLLIGTACLVIVLPANYLQNLPLYVNIANIVLGLTALYFYRASLAGRNHIELFFIILVLSISSTWFPNAGSQGSIAYYLLVMVAMPIALSQGRIRWVLVGFLQVNLCVLLLLEHYFPYLITPFESPTGRIIDLISGVICSTMVITLTLWIVLKSYELQHHLTENFSRKLAISEKNYREVVESANTIIVKVDQTGAITFINRFAETLFGCSRMEICGKKIFDSIIPPTSPTGANHQNKIEQLLKNPSELTPMELECRRHDGAHLWVSWINQSLKNSDNDSSEILLMGTDITERKLAEERRLHEEQQRIHIQRLESIGFLAGGIAHDFNNILTAILGNASILKNSIPHGSADYELLAEVENASLRARDLTVQLLTFAQGGKPILSIVNPHQIVRNAVDEAPQELKSSCVINAAPDCWPIRADAIQIKQAVSNLLINAHQAMPNGGAIIVEIKNRKVIAFNGDILPAGGYVEIAVKDHGIGIPPENLKKIFDPYFTTKKDYAGLGLAVVYSIIKNHGGRILADSQVGKGTTFTLLLPAEADHVPSLPAADVKFSSQSRRILIMDDEESICRMVCRMLRKLGYEADQALDGAKALEMYRDAQSAGKPFAAVIMDLTIPNGMGGKQAIKALLEIDPHARAIVSSGYSNDPIMADHKAYGFYAVMQKPYTPKDFETTLNQILSLSMKHRKVDNYEHDKKTEN